MLDRLSNTFLSVTVDTTSGASEEILCGSYAGGIVFVPSGSSITTITWYVAEKPGGTYLVLLDDSGGSIVQTVAAGYAYALPAALFGARAAKAVGNAAGSVALTLKG